MLLRSTIKNVRVPSFRLQLHPNLQKNQNLSSSIQFSLYRRGFATIRGMATLPKNPLLKNNLFSFNTLTKLPSTISIRYNSTTHRISSDFDPNVMLVVRFLISLVFLALIVSYLSDTRAGFYKYVLMPLIHLFIDPEDAHVWSVYLASLGLAPKERGFSDDSRLHVKIWNKELKNPVGLAAGYDKNATCVDASFDFGFGMVEIGSVTPKPQPGNERPRMFRLSEDKAAINRYGLNGDGVHVVQARLANRIRDWFFKNATEYPADQTPPQMLDSRGFNRSLRDQRLLGVNVSKNKSSPADSNMDYIVGVKVLGPFADYLTINVSCPNQVGITSLQRKGVLEGIMKEVVEARSRYCPNKPPILVKIGPDMTHDELRDVAHAVLSTGVDGVIISNTTNQRPESLHSGMWSLVFCETNLPDISKTKEWGGLSGPPLKPLALKTLSDFHKLTKGKVPLIGCGGISNAQDAIEFARAGATLIQLYTGMSYQGPGIVYDIKKGILDELEKIGPDTKWVDIVGKPE